MGLFRKEPLHERLAREGGLLQPDSENLRPSWDKVGVHGLQRPRAWDVVVMVEVPGHTGTEVEFVSLADGSLVIGEEDGEGEVSPAAEAVETQLEPPYRAHAVRRQADVWAVAARGIEVATLPADGEEIELSEHDGSRRLIVDGMQEFGTIPQLEAIGRREGDSYVVRARRLDGDLWEVSVDPL